MTKRMVYMLVAVIIFAPAVWASKDMKEAKKLDKELKKVSLVAAVPDGRRVVNRVMAQEFGLSRQELVKERQKTGFAYGQLFGAHEVGQQAGMKFEDVAAAMKQGESLLDISAQHKVDLGEILAHAKTMNKQIGNELDRAAAGGGEESADDGDDYDPSNDALSADTADFSPSQIAQANQMVHGRGLGMGNAMSPGQGGSMGSGSGMGSGMGGGTGRSMGGGMGSGGHH